jgi:glycosyltransferase involved in cell wall biosynthesis
MVDISGKVLNYDIALCEALSEVLPSKDHLVFFAANVNPAKVNCDCRKLISLVPKSLQNSENIVKRGFKALEGVINYLYLILYLLLHKVNVLHFQWLPFLEICSVEKSFLRIIKIVAPKTKIILTIHNLYPHNSSEAKKKAYKQRFGKIQRYIDNFILHLEISRKEFCKDFSIDDARTCVIPHGIFVPKGITIEPHKRGEKLNLIMYGNQSYYKGTDILVDALNLLPKDCQDKVHTVIVGKIAPDYYEPLKKKTECLDVEWIPEFVPDDVLYNKIAESDVIVIPYREISQSGVLLLALSFKRTIIASDLPSFKETLSELVDVMFFESKKPESLEKILEREICRDEYSVTQIELIDDVVQRYSWQKIASKYKHVYNKFVYG